MKLYFNQLQANLSRDLAPIYLVVGNEPLQCMEAADMIREAARTQGFTGRDLFFADQNFDWSVVRAAAESGSLFSEKCLIEVILGSNKLTSSAGVFFKFYAETLPPDTILFIRADKVDRRLAWVKQIEKQGVCVQVYPKAPNEMQAWLRERMLRAGLKMEEHVVELITERVEGNMLSAAQEIVKLGLLCEGKMVSQDDVNKFVGISSKFTVYDLASATCVGDIKKSLKILYSLKLDNSPLPLILWAMTAEIGKMIVLEKKLASGERMDTVLRSEWRNRQAMVRRALNRKLGHRWQNFLYWCAETDKAIKGLSDEDAWNELLQLVLRVGGVKGLSKQVASAG